jgi:hypothetical protein
MEEEKEGSDSRKTVKTYIATLFFILFYKQGSSYSTHISKNNLNQN